MLLDPPDEIPCAWLSSICSAIIGLHLCEAFRGDCTICPEPGCRVSSMHMLAHGSL